VLGVSGRIDALPDDDDDESVDSITDKKTLHTVNCTRSTQYKFR